MVNIAEALTLAAAHLDAGQLSDADRVLREVLELEPDHAEALHQLGLVALAARQFQPAIELIGRAIGIDESQPAFHANLAEAYRLAGKFPEAISANQAALDLDPQLPAPRRNLGWAYYQQGSFEAAQESFRRALEMHPHDARAHLALGRILKEQGRQAEAESCLRRAVELAPENAMARVMLGLALQDQQKLDEAREALEAALAIDPRQAAAHDNLGNILNQLQRPDESESHYRAAVRLDPRTTTAHNNLGALCLDQGRYQEAADSLTTAIEQNPRLTQAHCNLARALQELGKLDEAVTASGRAIELDPQYPLGHWDLASSLKPLGRLDEAIAAYREAIRLNPGGVYERSNLIYALNFHGGYDAASVFAEHRRWGQTHADPLTAASPPHSNDRTPSRRLRLGYVSGHFWEHAVNFFSEPILAAHDHTQFEVFCYANAARSDQATRRLRGYADQWREITRQNDEQAAELVRRDQIDILVDLTGHIAGHRLLLFARKPAPVQVTYLGYQNTTGMAGMDYRLTDEWSDPPGMTDPYYTEKLVRLSGSFFCYQPSSYAPPVGPLPALANGYVTFGSFNNFAKVTPQVLATWAQLLKRVSGARLVILASAAASLEERLLRTFERHGIDSQRLILAKQRPRGEYLDLIAQTDVALDPFPFNGHTTTCDALWQGLPVVTLAGRMYASRFGSSAHQSLGLEELIAHAPEEYVEIAVRLAGDPDRLAQLRSGLRPRMAASRLLDFAGFTRNLEAAYRTMWTKWCASGA